MQTPDTLMGATQATVLAEQLNAAESDGWTYRVVEVGQRGLCKIEVYDEQGEFVSNF